MKIALSHVDAGKLPLEHGPIVFSRDAHKVKLHTFEAWARSVGWVLPESFPKAIEQAAPAQTPAAPAPVVAASDAPAIPKNQRPDLLAPLIEKAQRGESDPFNAAVIWPKLCDMAEQKLKPFIGKTGDGLQWIDAFDDPQFMSKNALSDRLRRAKKAAIELAKPR
ncbi:MAG: hypothetical protein IPH54_07990 [Rhodoferax sp.]|nr:hypothetical protein [Rhodoferax sp.]